MSPLWDTEYHRVNRQYPGCPYLSPLFLKRNLTLPGPSRAPLPLYYYPPYFLRVGRDR